MSGRPAERPPFPAATAVLPVAPFDGADAFPAPREPVPREEVEFVEVGVSVQSGLRRQPVRAAVVLVVAAGVAAAVVILAGAVALPASAWFPAGAVGGAASAGQPVPTPQLLEWRPLDHGDLRSTWLLADDDAGGPDWRPGVAVTCSAGLFVMSAFFGPYPVDGSPVQFAVRTADGRVSQGTVVTAVGVPQPYVSDVVRARYRTITVANARRFARYCGCLIEDLFPADAE